MIIKRDSREENIYYLPALCFTSYLCSIGGILSMWIGISVLGEGKRIFNFILAIKLKLLNHSKNNYHKILKCFKFVFLFLCIAFSSLQTYNTLGEYFSYEYIVRVSSDVQLVFPSIKIIQGIPYFNIENLLNQSNHEMRESITRKYFSDSIKINCNLFLSQNNNQSEIIPCDQYYHQEK